MNVHGHRFFCPPKLVPSRSLFNNADGPYRVCTYLSGGVYALRDFTTRAELALRETRNAVIWTSSWMRIIRRACCIRNTEKIRLGSMLTSLSSIQAERN